MSTYEVHDDERGSAAVGCGAGDPAWSAGDDADLLTLDGIGVRLGGRQVLSDVTFSLGKGEFTGIIGPNGAGKTTLLRVILGLLEPSGGRVLIDGEPVHSKNKAASATCRRSSSSTPTCRCAPATSCRSALTGTGSASPSRRGSAGNLSSGALRRRRGRVRRRPGGRALRRRAAAGADRARADLPAQAAAARRAARQPRPQAASRRSSRCSASWPASRRSPCCSPRTT